ncbi:lysoplasmalogenase [uncultured Stenotrophomonas sp.]|uniref:lysoplasmalogenase n=1 Tax=uncultured Stenotrophomonas sp. TaxID=165438 RepID=UPI0025CBED5D|nr:lysoplasmalogenase [uncultured Stenotrophomonas sp.]
MVTATGSTIIICLAACAVLVVCEYRGWKLGKVLLKILASTAFLALALQLGATASAYGQLILVGLGLGWVGDVLLLSQKSRLFLLGLASFLLAHMAYAIAFASLPIASTALALAFAVMSCLGIAVIAWLWSYLKAFYRVAVVAYVTVIVAMCALAIAVSAASGAWQLAAGAVMFAISDIAVARNRFVAAGARNKLWGLPLYYVAQIILASSVAGVHANAS